MYSRSQGRSSHNKQPTSFIHLVLACVDLDRSLLSALVGLKDVGCLMYIYTGRSLSCIAGKGKESLTILECARRPDKVSFSRQCPAILEGSSVLSSWSVIPFGTQNAF